MNKRIEVIKNHIRRLIEIKRLSCTTTEDEDDICVLERVLRYIEAVEKSDSKSINKTLTQQEYRKNFGQIQEGEQNELE